MDKMSFIDAPELKTGNGFADYLNVTRLSLMPEYWALVDYLEQKGVIDGKEFMAFWVEISKRRLSRLNILPTGRRRSRS